MLLALVACEEAAPPKVTLPSVPPAAAEPTEPASKIVTLVIVGDEAGTRNLHRPDHRPVNQRLENSNPATWSRTIRFPVGFKAGVRHDLGEHVYQWWAFESHPIIGAFTNTEILSMGGESLDNGESWYLRSIEVSPSFRLNIRAILGTDGSTAASLIVTLFADVTLDLLARTPYTTVEEADAVVTRHLATNSIVVSLRL